MRDLQNNLLKIIILLIFVLGIILFACNSNKNNNIEHKYTTKNILYSDTSLIDKLTKQIIKDSKNPQLYKKRAEAYFAQKNISDAISDMEKAISLDSTNTEYLNLISEYWIIYGNSKPTKEYLDKSLNIDPENTETLTKMSKLYLFVKNYSTSFEYANKALKINPNLYTPYFVKALCYYELEQPKRAKRELLNAVTMNPDFYDAYQLLGVICTEDSDTLAPQYFKQAIKMKPNSIESHYSLGYYFQENEKYSKAKEEYNYIIKNIDSTYANAYYNLGYINLVYLDDYKKAKQFFEKTIQLDSINANAYYNLGLSYEKLRNKIKAEENYSKALKLNPNHELARKALKRI